MAATRVGVLVVFADVLCPPVQSQDVEYFALLVLWTVARERQISVALLLIVILSPLLLVFSFVIISRPRSIALESDDCFLIDIAVLAALDLELKALLFCILLADPRPFRFGALASILSV